MAQIEALCTSQANAEFQLCAAQFLRQSRWGFALRPPNSEFLLFEVGSGHERAAMQNWFWYATDVASAGDAHGPGTFLSGYAVQKGGFLAWRF